MNIKIIKEKDDPIGINRASIGGTEDVGYYLVYRGDAKRILMMLKKVIDRFEELITD